MTRFFLGGRLRAALAITVTLALLLPALPATSVSAQGSDARFKAAMK
ncbi:MAG: hypothetical protein AB1Z67_04585 [Candidatus Limnocylindrales bacterium]